MKRDRIELAAIADWDNLHQATWRASRGKRSNPEAAAFLNDLDRNLRRLRDALLTETCPLGESRVFRIRDPKPRTIHAPAFRERVLHHAIMTHAGPALDRSLVEDTYACRCGKGTLAAVLRSQQHARRFRWYAKMDVRSYFASIDQRVLKRLLRQRLKGSGVLRLLDRIIDAHQAGVGRGLPIGALTSQNFANFYLNGLDRLCLETSAVRGYVRYMDDFVVWCDTRTEVQKAVASATEFLRCPLRLELKQAAQVQQSRLGLTICGFRVFPGTIRLAQRRRQRLGASIAAWERRYANGEITEEKLQRAFDAIVGMARHADTDRWLAQFFLRRGVASADAVG